MQPDFLLKMSQSAYLSILTGVPTYRLKPFVESLISSLGNIDVLLNRTGLIMVPGTDTVQGTNFHLGEVLVSEAHVRIEFSTGSVGEGYAACLGRDLEQSLAIAILDAALQAEVMSETIFNFIKTEADLQTHNDSQLMRRVEATRVEMETF